MAASVSTRRRQESDCQRDGPVGQSQLAATHRETRTRPKADLPFELGIQVVERLRVTGFRRPIRTPRRLDPATTGRTSSRNIALPPTGLQGAADIGRRQFAGLKLRKHPFDACRCQRPADRRLLATSNGHCRPPNQTPTRSPLRLGRRPLQGLKAGAQTLGTIRILPSRSPAAAAATACLICGRS
jgi:hypothetical protein